MQRVKLGVIGCGNISGIYFKNLTEVFGDILEVRAVCDLIPQRAQAAREQFGFSVVQRDEDIFNDPEIEMLLNITRPWEHYDVNRRALLAGKHVYCEKPLGITREEGREILELARERGLLAGGAPDTYLGAGLQTCRKLIDDGWIGNPVAATAFMMNHGHESWHPGPEFYYQAGGGPMLDMGPYYLTALISLMGPVASVMGSTAITFPTRTITSQPQYGKVIPVEVPTYVAGLLNFQSGAKGTLITTFDVWSANLPFIEIYGSEGTLSVPDPNCFGGPVRYRRHDASEFSEIPLIFGYEENSRGLGLADMAMALRGQRKPRNGIALTYHVLDIMCAIHESAGECRQVELSSSSERPALLSMNLMKGQVNP
jgi:predicted dehydrogenase